MFHAYDISDTKADELTERLRDDLIKVLEREPVADERHFRYVVLLDDFTASGLSYIRWDEQLEGWKGKIPKILAQLKRQDGLGQCIANSGVRVIVVLYIASRQAMKQIQELLDKIDFNYGTIELRVVSELDDNTRLEPDDECKLFDLINKSKYFDTSADDEHSKVGGSSMRMWIRRWALSRDPESQYPEQFYIPTLGRRKAIEFLGLFPRVSRHRQFK